MRRTKVAINGLGRIGRAFLKLAKDIDEIEVVAINDLGSLENLAYLLKYDTVYKSPDFPIKVVGETLVFNGKEIKFFNEKNPLELPWGKLEIDVVLEATGVFREIKDANMHLIAGAKRVLLTATTKGEPVSGVKTATVLMGINEEELKTCDISSNASCTTNAASPIITILEEHLDIEKALLDTIHGYTANQSLVDTPNEKDYRRGRAAAMNLVPSTTGAATALTKAVKGIPFFDGISVRVPVVIGSYVDLTFVTRKNTSKEDVNDILRKASKEERWKGIFAVTDEPLVSSDIIGNTNASVADLSFTRVVGGNLIKVMAWYDNETGYANTLVKHIIEVGKIIK